MRSSRRADLIPKIFCFLLALSIVVFFNFMTLESREVELPLTVILPEGYTALNTLPNTITLVMNGDASLVYLVNPDAIEAVADFSVIPSQTLQRSVNTPPGQLGKTLSVPVQLFYSSGIISLGKQLTITASPSSIDAQFQGSL
ncbi:MAG: hypothetical protein PHI83_03145 [Sphaerochaetaceae bacterium]|jgi:hypothetical protein|nr:hypothetical protein [Sphaerochaetaceae bacterium]